MEKSKKKLVNFRLPFALFLSLTCGIAFTYAFYYFKIEKLYLLTAVPVAVVFFITFALLIKKRTLSFAVIALAFLMGTYVCFAHMSAYDTQQTDGEAHTITGVVAETGSTRAYNYVILTNAYSDDTKLDGKVYVQIYDGAGENCAVGYTVRFTSKVNKYDLIVYGKLNYRAADNIKYYASVSNNGLSSTYGYSLFGAVRSGIYAALFNNLSYQTASVGYAMLIGDTTLMEEETLSAFRYGGIAHIFAVSGLHIGILFAALSFIIKKLRINKKLGAAIIVALLFFYVGVCGFTPSSVRAAVMCSVALFAKLVFKKYDGINAVSVAAAILLVINPFYLFGVGFQLSFAAVYGIMFLSHNLNAIFSFLPKRVKSSLAFTLSAQLATFPILLINFGYVSLVGLLLNIFIIPLMSALYIALLASSIVCCLFQTLGATLMPVVCTPLEGFLSFAVGTGWESALISGLGGWCVFAFIALLIIALSDKFNFKRMSRACISFVAVGSLVVYAILREFMPLGDARIIVNAYYGGGAVIVKTGSGTMLIVTEDMTVNRISSTLNYYASNNLDGVIILGGEDCLQIYYDLDVNCSDVYLYDGYTPIDAAGIKNVHYQSTFTVGGVTYKFSDGYSVSADVNGVTVGICAGETTNIKKCDMLVSRYVISGCRAATKVYFNLKHHQNNIYECGDLQFSINSGTISAIGLSHYVKSGE
jgi:ComEC/Rec2-related protein